MGSVFDLCVTLRQARNLKDTRLVGRQDPYCVVEVAGTRLYTHVARDGHTDPQWDQTLVFTGVSEADDPLIFFKVFSKEAFGQDTLIGEAQFSVMEYLTGKEMRVGLTRKRKVGGTLFVTLFRSNGYNSGYAPLLNNLDKLSVSAGAPHPHQRPHVAPQPPHTPYPPFTGDINRNRDQVYPAIGGHPHLQPAMTLPAINPPQQPPPRNSSTPNLPTPDSTGLPHQPPQPPPQAPLTHPLHRLSASSDTSNPQSASPCSAASAASTALPFGPAPPPHSAPLPTAAPPPPWRPPEPQQAVADPGTGPAVTVYPRPVSMAPPPPPAAAAAAEPPRHPGIRRGITRRTGMGDSVVWHDTTPDAQQRMADLQRQLTLRQSQPAPAPPPLPSLPEHLSHVPSYQQQQQQQSDSSSPPHPARVEQLQQHSEGSAHSSPTHAPRRLLQHTGAIKGRGSRGSSEEVLAAAAAAALEAVEAEQQDAALPPYLEEQPVVEMEEPAAAEAAGVQPPDSQDFQQQKQQQQHEALPAKPPAPHLAQLPNISAYTHSTIKTPAAAGGIEAFVRRPTKRSLLPNEPVPRWPCSWLFPKTRNKDIGQTYVVMDQQCLGEGSFGRVYRCMRKRDQKQFAVKLISKAKIDGQEALEDILHEVQIMHHLSRGDHPNVVKLVDVFEDVQYVMLILDLCTGCDLSKHLARRGCYSEADVAKVARALVGTIAYCHQNGVMHRDLKLENLLMSDSSDDAVLKVTDFGFSTFFTEDQLLDDCVGSLLYMAPELLRKRYNKEADIWSCGVILYMLLCGHAPFQSRYGEADIERAILDPSCRPSFTRGQWQEVSMEAKDCVMRMLEKDPKRRATAQQVLSHEWLRSGRASNRMVLRFEVLENMKAYTGTNNLQKAALKLVALSLPGEEIQGLLAQFKAMDLDKNGSITAQELRACLAAKHTHISDQQLEELMAHADADGDGEIDYEEFIAATLSHSKLLQEEVLREVFHEFDRDGSGSITADELEQMLRRLRLGHPHMRASLRLDEVRRLIQQHDRDSDGCLSFDEFKRAFVMSG